MALDTMGKLKLALRISHDKLDDDIQSDIDACLADLAVHGIIHPQISDPLIYKAVKLYLHAGYDTDPDKAAKWLTRYESLRTSLRMAEGYGWRDDPSEGVDADD